MDVLTYQGLPLPFFTQSNIKNTKLLDPPHDAEYIVPPCKYYQHDAQTPPYRRDHANLIHRPDPYYFSPIQRHSNTNIWLDKRNHDRIQNWLAEQHHTGYPPPEHEFFTTSLRPNSAVDLLNNDKSSLGDSLNHLSKFQPEEQIAPACHETDEQKRATALRRRYNSPDCIRRRYISPRSDPSLNTVGKQHFLPAGIASYKQLPPWNEQENNPEFLNRAFYQSGKGNTFPRRAAQKSTSRNLLNISRKDVMGQHMEKYQQSVLLNPHANSDYHDKFSSNPYINNDTKKLEEPLLAGRTFVLNGITLQSKKIEENANKNVNEKEESEIVITSYVDHVENTPISPIEITDSETIKENEEASTNQSDNSIPIKKQASFHIRVASAPATTDSNKLHRDLYWRDDETKRRVSHKFRKVKALSWPKRAILPEHSPDLKFIENYKKKMTGSTSDVKDVKKYLTGGGNDDALSDVSDVPPARPPLPPEHMYVKREGSNSSGDRFSSKHSNQKEINEETIVPETKNDVHRLNEEKKISLCSADENQSVTSDNFYHHSNCELSKRVSMSLKDLIRIHEQEIARVSGAFSTRTLDKIEEKDHKTSFTCEERKTQEEGKWKRHTTIGLLGEYSHDDQLDQLSNQNLSEINDYHNNEKDELTPLSPTGKKLSIAISSRTSGSEVSVLSPKLEDRSIKSPPSTLPKPKKVMTSSVVTFPLQSITSKQYSPQTHGCFQVLTGTSYTSYMSDSSVQTEERLVRSPSFRRNETRLKELTEENENMRRNFEEERKLLNKKLQEQTKLANAYQKLEDRYRKKVYDLQKAMKMCTCSNGRYGTYPSHHGDHFRPDDASIDDSNEISVQKVDVILNKLKAWLNHQPTTYPESEMSSLFGSTLDDLYTQNNKGPADYYGGRNGAIPLDRIIDRIDATSV